MKLNIWYMPVLQVFMARTANDTFLLMITSTIPCRFMQPQKNKRVDGSCIYHLYDYQLLDFAFSQFSPWGRPDMALFKFAEAILNNQKISVHNFGQHKRDFTYIDDIVEGVIKFWIPPKPNKNWNEMAPISSSIAPWCVYNIGSSNPVELVDFIRAIEISTGKKANIEMLPLQMGDVLATLLM